MSELELAEYLAAHPDVQLVTTATFEFVSVLARAIKCGDALREQELLVMRLRVQRDKLLEACEKYVERCRRIYGDPLGDECYRACVEAIEAAAKV